MNHSSDFVQNINQVKLKKIFNTIYPAISNQFFYSPLISNQKDKFVEFYIVV